jgi:hypothetical protein
LPSGIAQSDDSSGRAADRGTEAEELRVCHEDGSGAFSQRRQRRGQRKSGIGSDANLRLAAEVRDRQPATIEFPKSELHVKPKRFAGEAGVRANEAWLLIHARSVATDRDSLLVA